MMKLATGLLVLMVVFAAAFTPNARAQTNTNAIATESEFSLEDNFRPGFREVSLGCGPMLAVSVKTGRPRVDYFLAFGQVGYMLNRVGGPGILRGNFELTAELFGGAIWETTGNYVAGGTIWTRYNFVPAGWRFAPYLQIGLGVESMDIDHIYDGHNVNFNVDATGGARYFLTQRVSLNAELRYQHFSNADTGSHNIGLNSIGPVVGVSWFF